MSLRTTLGLYGNTTDLSRGMGLIKNALDPVLAQAFTSGRVIEGISVTAGTPFTVQHGLGRAWAGWEVTKVTGASAMVMLRAATVTPTPNPNTTVALQSSATATIDVRVF